MNFPDSLVLGASYMPHGMCYQWNDGLVALHALSDAFIAMAYYSIPLSLVYFVRERRDLAFHWIFLLFALFIVACGTTHLLEIFNIWTAYYWLSGWVKLATAVFSIFTAVLLVQLIPKALALPSPDSLREANAALIKEIEDRRIATEHVTKLNAELRAQTELLEAANRELESFSYSVSHDLRAPLRHIHGFVEILREECGDKLDEPGQRYVGIIAASTERMGTLIDDLLSFSRMGRMEIHRAKLDMAALVRETIAELDAETKGREVQWKVGSLPAAEGDRELLKLVLTNLLGNAVKYTRQRPIAVIEISGREVDDELEYSIKDNGAGFDMQYVTKLFTIFQRLHHTEEFEGTGIGLANVRRIILRHGGRTWAEGAVNGGATFFFSLPRIGAKFTTSGRLMPKDGAKDVPMFPRVASA